MPLDAALPAPFHNISADWYNAIAFVLAAVVLVIATRGRLGYQQNAESSAETKSRPGNCLTERKDIQWKQ